MASEICVSCHDPLLVHIASDTDGDSDGMSDGESKAIIASASAKAQASTAQFVIDDVELNCGCHFHWECFLDSSTITECPSCNKAISSLSQNGQQQVLVTVRNEGGVQENYDILPSATEEAYLRAYPEERRGHAFLEFVREGDIDAVVCLLMEDTQQSAESLVRDDDDEVEVGEMDIDVLRYCGTFEGIEGSALHVAIRYQREELAWLLLALGSALPWNEFPAGAMEALKSLGLRQEDRRAVPDIRSVKDGDERLPVDLAKEMGGIWIQWIEGGKLSP